ncbi:MAG: glycosyltransferase [Rhodopseudomonas palustris]|nr:glycosyltransferase [Rhodopseudomonas palustris]
MNGIPSYVDWIIVIDDASQDDTLETLRQLMDPRVMVIDHDRNQGVGGAMVTGFKIALESQG